ncbi:MAG: hypothetical protein B7X99_10050 [Rhizobiales bacterium 17-65-6]|nr:MAG: hypothetical protein B7X99_10050 [Rhizobiales bacterium 17-65-6]
MASRARHRQRPPATARFALPGHHLPRAAQAAREGARCGQTALRSAGPPARRARKPTAHARPAPPRPSSGPDQARTCDTRRDRAAAGRC